MAWILLPRKRCGTWHALTYNWCASWNMWGRCSTRPRAISAWQKPLQAESCESFRMTQKVICVRILAGFVSAATTKTQSSAITSHLSTLPKADANIFAALSTVSMKQCAPHLYKAARDRIATDFYMWGPLPTLVLVGEQWQRRCALAANTMTTSIWVILSGVLEFTLPDKTPKAFAAGSVVVSDLLLRGGHVARLTDDTRVLWGCAPKWRSLQKNSRLREQMRKSRASKKLIGRLRLSARRARSHRWDVRRRTMPPCEHCVLSVL